MTTVSLTYREDRIDSSPQREQVLDAALVCVGRWGLTKTTLEDIGRESAVSRATVYRMFPGGKTALLTELAQREVLTTTAAVTLAINRSDTLVDAVSSGIVIVATGLANDPVIDYLITHEREVFLPFVSFDRMSDVLNLSADWMGPALERFVDAATAREIVEWSARLVLSQFINPQELNLQDPDAVVRLWKMTNFSRLQQSDLSTTQTSHQGGTS